MSHLTLYRMKRFKYYNEFSKHELEEGYNFMTKELEILSYDHPIHLLFQRACDDFVDNQFGYDGATFVRERSHSLFEVAAFIHDWRNSKGYVGKEIDREFFTIMEVLDYPKSLIRWRKFLCHFTFLNILRHKLLKSYNHNSPKDLY